MVFLLISVMLYDNPLFPLILLANTSFTAVVDACFTVTFFCTLLMFWLCVYHGIRKTERHFFSFYLPKMLMVGLLWVIGCVMLSWSAAYQSVDPTYSISQVLPRTVASVLSWRVQLAEGSEAGSHRSTVVSRAARRSAKSSGV